MRLDRILSAGNGWPYGIFQVVSFGSIVYALFQEYSWQWWAAAFLVQQICVGVGISVGYHRYFTHRAFEASKALRYLFMILATWTVAGSPSGFALVHRHHHKLSDKPGDPHAPSLRGWRIFSSKHGYMTPEASLTGYKLREEFYRNYPGTLTLHKYLWAFASLPPLLLFPFGFEAILFLWLIPMSVRLWVGPFSLWWSHRNGSWRYFDTDDYSNNSFIIGFFLWEGPHNTHHKFPGLWNYRVKWFDYDPGAAIVKLFFWLGLARPKRFA